jgi:hypothetical protein
VAGKSRKQMAIEMGKSLEETAGLMIFQQAMFDHA